MAKGKARQEMKVALWHVLMEGHSIQGEGRKERPWSQLGARVGSRHTSKRWGRQDGFVFVALCVRIWELSGLRKASCVHAGYRVLTEGGLGHSLNLSRGCNPCIKIPPQ